jgi:hypothetical protein
MDAAKSTVGWLALLTTFVVGGASGYAARLGLEREPRGEEGGTLASGLAELRASVTRLEDSVTELSRSQTVLVSAPRPERESSAPAKEVLDLRSLEELVTRFERATARASTAGTGALVFPVGRPQPIPPGVDGDEENAALRERFLFLSYQQVLDALGRPDGVYVTKIGNADAVLWSYARSNEPGVYDHFGLYFRDGLVVEVDP